MELADKLREALANEASKARALEEEIAAIKTRLCRSQAKTVRISDLLTVLDAEAEEHRQAEQQRQHGQDHHQG